MLRPYFRRYGQNQRHGFVLTLTGRRSRPADSAGSDRGVSNEDLRPVAGHRHQAQAVRKPLFRLQVKRHGCRRSRWLGPAVWLRREPHRRGWIEVQVPPHRIVFHGEAGGRLDYTGYAVAVKRNAVDIHSACRRILNRAEEPSEDELREGLDKFYEALK